MAESPVTFTVGLLEKLSGMKKPQPPKRQQPQRPTGHVSLPLPPRLPVSPDAARLIAQDQQLSRQLQATREVAGLLVKQEEAEVAKMKSLATDLTRQYSVETKPLPCQAEAQACKACFVEHPKEAWRCSDAAEAYRLCSVRAFNAGSNTATSTRGAAVARG